LNSDHETGIQPSQHEAAGTTRGRRRACGEIGDMDEPTHMDTQADRRRLLQQAVVVLGGLGLLAACGRKGDLYLPEPDKRAPGKDEAPGTPVEPEPETREIPPDRIDDDNIGSEITP
jgi:predicted small lipoprotein YifL